MSGLEDLRAKQSDIINWLRDAEVELVALRDQATEAIENVESHKYEIESAYEALHHIEDEILRLS